ncbi:hypothetical protein SBA3_3430002 [Candidatus Sulfopaludibacter sp. SbA3]|nr:hypothetical protein SBA3_3430002 [Candidatus Sulfopaludibacter sp. SbA3]
MPQPATPPPISRNDAPSTIPNDSVRTVVSEGVMNAPLESSMVAAPAVTPSSRATRAARPASSRKPAQTQTRGVTSEAAVAKQSAEPSAPAPAEAEPAATPVDSTQERSAAIVVPLSSGDRLGRQPQAPFAPALPETSADEAKPVELAFTARLVPTAAPGSTPDAAAPKPADSRPPEPVLRASDAALTAMADPPRVTVPRQVEPVPRQPDTVVKTDAERPHRPEKTMSTPDAHTGKESPDTSATAVRAAEPAGQTTAQPTAVLEARPSNRTPESASVEVPPATTRQDPTPAREPVNPPAAAREIKLQFGGGDSRVQVQVAARAGEVKVAVHTPDADLAGALREDLPSLAARLEQAGFHSETWHGPAAQPAEGPRAGEPLAGSPQQDASGSEKRNSGGQQNEQQQRQKAPEEPAAGKPSRRDFSSLFSSLR